MGLVKVESTGVFRLLERLFGWFGGIEFVPKGERTAAKRFVGKDEEFTLADAETIITNLGYKKSQVSLRNTMFRAGRGTWAHFAERLNEAGGIGGLAWEVNLLSEQVAQAVFEYGFCQGLLVVKEY